MNTLCLFGPRHHRRAELGGVEAEDLRGECTAGNFDIGRELHDETVGAGVGRQCDQLYILGTVIGGG